MKKLRQEFADTMLEVGLQEPRLIVMVGDISHGILQPFAKAYPGRYFNIGICEPTIVNMAAGIAKTGLIPVVHTIAPFIIERAYEQIKLDFGYQKLGLNLISVGSAFDYAQLGCSHHCYTDISLMSHFQNSQIFFPASPIELNILFKSVFDKGTINYFRLPEVSHGIPLLPEDIRPGKAIKIMNGENLTIVAIGPQLKTAIAASHLLKNRNLSTEILYYPTIKPFDSDILLASIIKTRKVLVIEEVSAQDGVFNRVLRALKDVPDVQYSQIAIRDFIHMYGTYEELCEEAGFSVKGILSAIDRDFTFELSGCRS